LIKDVKIKKLKVVPDERGRLMEMLRSDDDLFIKFGQAYMTTAYPGVVKGWHYHKKQVDNFTIVKGMMKVVLYDSRKDSPTYKEVNEFFMCINLPSEVYDYNEPDEFRVDPHSPDIPYDWNRNDG